MYLKWLLFDINFNYMYNQEINIYSKYLSKVDL